jgi:gliding motility-associated lipoprotein GldH
MRVGVFAILTGCILVLSSCGDGKVYQEYTDFNARYWLVSDTAKFSFSIEDTTSRYNVYCNLRNSTQYPFSRIFLNFSLSDSTRKDFHTSLLNDFLFDPKSGEPLGKTGLGDLYDHQLTVLKNYKFAHSGPFMVNIEQFMRTDTLQGILSVGVGIEKVSKN